MLHCPFQATDPEMGRREYTRPDSVEEADMLTAAATDTAATAVADAFFYLLRSSRAYSKLKDEVRNMFQSTNDISMGSQLSSCKYLYAVINETLRMSPAGGNEFPREVMAGDFALGRNIFLQVRM